jgi:NAD(P)-dependent dehydrogenase (short-subunit alcohol dehydrogenase family)
LTLLPLDVADEQSIAQAAARVAAESTGLDILFNNSALFTDRETIRDFSAEKAIEMLNVNAVGPMLVAKHFIPLLKAGERPCLICISSEAGSISRMTSFRGYYYYGSKALLNMFGRALAWDPETQGITVIALHPGWVRTDMGGRNATLSPAESAAGILRVTAGLAPADNGKFYTWEGKEYPW